MLNENELLMREIILAFIKNRDFMGCQLSYESGMMNDDQFNKICDQCLTDRSMHQISEKDIKKVKLLCKLVPKETDSELISMLLACSMDQAFELKGKIENEI